VGGGVIEIIMHVRGQSRLPDTVCDEWAIKSFSFFALSAPVKVQI
jgi:hypothetical protein